MKRVAFALVLGILSIPTPASADHEYDRCYEGDCYEQSYDQDNQNDKNRNRNRNRGAFSPGPFDDSPVDAFNGNVICLPGSTCHTDDRQREGQPQEPQ